MESSKEENIITMLYYHLIDVRYPNCELKNLFVSYNDKWYHFKRFDGNFKWILELNEKILDEKGDYIFYFIYGQKEHQPYDIPSSGDPLSLLVKSKEEIPYDKGSLSFSAKEENNLREVKTLNLYKIPQGDMGYYIPKISIQNPVDKIDIVNKFIDISQLIAKTVNELSENSEEIIKGNHLFQNLGLNSENCHSSLKELLVEFQKHNEDNKHTEVTKFDNNETDIHSFIIVFLGELKTSLLSFFCNKNKKVGEYDVKGI
jgi:hypothetical protein